MRRKKVYINDNDNLEQIRDKIKSFPKSLVLLHLYETIKYAKGVEPKSSESEELRRFKKLCYSYKTYQRE